MTRRHLSGLAFGAILFAGVTASAQEAPSSEDPSATPTTPTTTTTTTTTTPTPPPTPVTPGPAPSTQPVVVVNPAPATVPVTEPTDEEYDEWNAPMFTTGALVFAGSYGASVIVAGTSDRKGDDRLYVPILGPWLDLADRGSCPIEQSSCDHETTDKVLLVADGVFQAAGLLAMVDGLFVPVHHHHTVIEARREYKKIHVAPVTMGHASPGFAISGHF